MDKDGGMAVTLPAVQQYAENSFGLGSNTMVAVTEDKSDMILQFKNLCGYLVVKLYGEGTVSSVRLEGNNGEKISGRADVQASYGTLPSIEMADEATTSITIDCGEGVTLGTTAETATEFWFCVPPVTFSEGFTIAVQNSDGMGMTKRVTSSRSITRNTANTMSPLPVSFDDYIGNSKPYALLNKSIIVDQQDPNVAERVFVLYWADIARQDGESGYCGRCIGRSNDEWAGCLYTLTRNCVTDATNAIKLVNEQLPGLSGHEAEFFPNVKAVARIWRVYLMTEFVDSFGSFTTDFESANPQYESVEDCYKFMFKELEEAVADINLNVVATSDVEKNADPAYQFDPAKWKNFGISMWMRLAMRLSGVDEATAMSEFSKAMVAGTGITTVDGTFRVKESTGWDDLSGVMSRTWDWQEVSATFANLTTNFGGVPVETTLKDVDHRLYPASPKVNLEYGPYIKDASEYLGIHIADSQGNLYEEYTDNPTKGFFFDGIPSYLDPRALAYFCLPGDYDNRKETGYCTFMRVNGEVISILSNRDNIGMDATYAWNGLQCGFGYDYYISYTPFIKNDYGTTYPSLQERYRNGNEYRVFFGPWETHLLKAEAIVRGYISGDAEKEYNDGIKASFDYLGMSSLAADYIEGTNYNRVGTSVKWSHTDEPENYEIAYTDPISGSLKTTIYEYPVASHTLYGVALNDHLSKIITQKYIANTPWLPLENWSDHRRTGLPFWEIPVSSSGWPFLDGWTTHSYETGQEATFYPGRMNYPSKFQNETPEEYRRALNLMGIYEEKTCTPLWWAKKYRQ